MPSPEQRKIPYSSRYGQGVQDAQALAAVPPPPPEPALEAAPTLPGESHPDLLPTLLEPTTRPAEPITAGLREQQQAEYEALREWAPLLQEMAAQPDVSPQLRRLAQAAAVYFGR